MIRSDRCQYTFDYSLAKWISLRSYYPNPKYTTFSHYNRLKSKSYKNQNKIFSTVSPLVTFYTHQFDVGGCLNIYIYIYDVSSNDVRTSISNVQNIFHRQCYTEIELDENIYFFVLLVFWNEFSKLNKVYRKKTFFIRKRERNLTNFSDRNSKF